VGVDDDVLAELAGLLAARNDLDRKIGALIGRPMTAGHLGEFIASRVFGIEPEGSASAKAIDGRFTTGSLAGRTVNIKWYLKREGLLDLTLSNHLDHYLVLTGPASAAASSRGRVRPWVIANVYLFDAQAVREDLIARGRRVGVASSVRAAEWAAAEAFLRQHRLLPLSYEQRQALTLFAGA
jgi:hypothetical protein